MRGGCSIFLPISGSPPPCGECQSRYQVALPLRKVCWAIVTVKLDRVGETNLLAPFGQYKSCLSSIVAKSQLAVGLYLQILGSIGDDAIRTPPNIHLQTELRFS